MGFSGGGSNILKAHTHDGTVSQDGGSLNADNITQMGMAAGDVMYSDGTHLQILNLGSATDTLTVNGAATAPEWAAAAAGSVGLTLLDNTVLTADQTTFDTSFTSVDQGSEMSGILAIFNGSMSANNGMYMQVGTGGGLITGGTAYYYSGVTWDGGAVAYTDSPNNSIWEPYPSGKDSEHISLIIHLWASSSTIATAADQTINMTSLGLTGVAATTNVGSYFWGVCDNGGTAVSSLDQIKFSAAAGNFLIGSQLAIYKIGV
jgi:hypothetical protein